MLYIRSTNAASFITLKTGKVAEVVSYRTDYGRIQNIFAFEKDEDVMDAFAEYRGSMSSQEPLFGDIVGFIGQFSYYKKESAKLTRQMRQKETK